MNSRMVVIVRDDGTVRAFVTWIEPYTARDGSTKFVSESPTATLTNATQNTLRTLLTTVSTANQARATLLANEAASAP